MSPWRSFSRTLADEARKLIESTCKACGHKIISTVPQGLFELEEDHLENCPMSRTNQAVAEKKRQSGTITVQVSFNKTGS